MDIYIYVCFFNYFFYDIGLGVQSLLLFNHTVLGMVGMAIFSGLPTRILSDAMVNDRHAGVGPLKTPVVG